MKTITWQEYSDSKADFYRRHGEYIEHSVLGEDGVNRKSVGFLDGANWYEVAEPVTETEIIERHGIRTAVEIEYRRVEIWDTENSRSRYLYTRESRRACKIAA